jgi:hypothetical protein
MTNGPRGDERLADRSPLHPEEARRPSHPKGRLAHSQVEHAAARVSFDRAFDDVGERATPTGPLEASAVFEPHGQQVKRGVCLGDAAHATMLACDDMRAHGVARHRGHGRGGRSSCSSRGAIVGALAFVEQADERAWSSEPHRLRGKLLRESDEAEAERAFARALEISREQGARSFELRAALSRAKFARGAWKKRAAREEPRGVHASFREGLGTGDLVEARTLLEAAR